ncbi:MAG: LTA synthase family protein [Muribaculaceae bacterium]
MKRIAQIPAFFFGVVVAMAVLKCLFMLAVGGFSLSDAGKVLVHGFSMDCSVAGYYTVVPALLTIASVWWRSEKIRTLTRIYIIIISILTAIIAAADTALYPYWGFKLDTTPIFYFVTSPSAAGASLMWWQWIMWPAVTAVLASGIFFWLKFCSFALRGDVSGAAALRHKWIATASLIVLTALLFLPIRGGVTVSTMSPARAYFSSDLRLNHAAINPVFNLLYSLTHQSHFDKQFRYFDEPELAEILAPVHFEPSDSLPRLEGKPDIYLIILEGFSAHLMPSLGGDSVAMRLDTLAREGVSFSRAYASSFRTDRALPAVLCGYPGQPTSSILKYVDKLDSLPSMPRTLSEAGYELHYYYGGDFAFANMSALAVASHFDNIVSDKDFPLNLRMSKWGVPDEHVFARAADDVVGLTGDRPLFTVVQTSSSHEPYDVDYHSRFANKKLNAFAYADSCLGDFVRKIQATPRGDNSVFVIVPDHYGSWPENLEDASARHHVPLVFFGKPIDKLNLSPALAGRIASQTDIAATVCALLGLDTAQFAFSQNLFDPARPEYAFFSDASWYAMLTPEGRAVISVDTHRPLEASSDSVTNLAKAYIQSLYTDLSQR